MSEIALSFKLHDAQLKIFESPARFIAVAAGRRFGKSRLACVRAITDALSERNERRLPVWIIAPTYGQARQIYWQQLLELAHPVIKQVKVNDGALTLLNDATIHVKGADRPDTMRGVALFSVVLDEFADMKVEVWEQIIRPALADLPKESGRFDLPIALGILAASRQIPAERLAGHEFAGELSLSGELRAVRGALAMTYRAARSGRAFVLPAASATEAALVRDAAVLPAATLLAVCAHLTGEAPLGRFDGAPAAAPAAYPDLADVRGQAQAKRALEVAAAGSHSLLLAGPPGTGKSMLATRLPGLLPPMTDEEALESAAVRSIASTGFCVEKWRERPYRSPHHSASSLALVGGGGNPRPGEISLAHRGVLFLDELPEFDRRVLEVLREPLESGRVTISRALRKSDFPARFQLVAAMNPCPCGYLGHYAGRCRCTPDQVARYRGKLSGPLLDRIDIHIDVPAVPQEELLQQGDGETSGAVRERVGAARARQLARQGKPNVELGTKEVERHCRADGAGETLLKQAISRLGLSARAYHRVLKLARTIADLAGAEAIAASHVGEAIGYRRRLERVG